ncbi:hypothetical protein AMS68_001665 [Peltaster fructicola]|uniref:Uncharacterized protein n=1 Tax=Peltaster fructicola TaxID=286661 RepID=A0A6H0XNF3_9PEZI|nr:hypothetical protein AMS68_001665 [Peltaster fructicola]
MRSVAFNTVRPIRAHATPARAPLCRPQFRRLQSQIIYQPDGQALRQRNVRFKRSIFTWRRLLTICTYGASVYLTLKYVPRLAGFDVSVEIVDDKESEKTTGAVEEQSTEGIELTEKDLEAAEDSLFIPMTWAQKMPKTYYKGSDPEWQEFIKIANDKERQKRILSDLISLFKTTATKHPMISRQLGGEIKPAKHWLDLYFPDGPPEEFVRSGLEFGDGYIAWSRQRIQQDKQHRTLRALLPKAVFDSTLAASFSLLHMQWHRLSHALGLKSNDGTSFEEKFKAAAAMMNKANRERNDLPKAQTDPDDSASTARSSTPVSRRYEPTELAQKALWPLPAPQLPQASSSDSADENNLRVAIAQHIFVRTLAKSWRENKVPVPRGTFVVHGIVELHGKNGRMGFDVQGVYDPKQSKFISLNAAVRHFKRWKQTPRGGN